MEAPSLDNWEPMFVFMIYVVVVPDIFKDYIGKPIEFEDLNWMSIGTINFV